MFNTHKRHVYSVILAKAIFVGELINKLILLEGRIYRLGKTASLNLARKCDAHDVCWNKEIALLAEQRQQKVTFLLQCNVTLGNASQVKMQLIKQTLFSHMLTSTSRVSHF